MSKQTLTVEDAYFSYENNSVLCGIDLEVNPGTCMCLMGVNGCGKSTLLDCILGNQSLSAGSIFVQGMNVKQLKPIQLAREISYVPQVHERSFPYLVDHIVLMGRTAYAKVLSAPNEDDEKIAYKALGECGILHLAKRPYTSLSGGEMQMVMLARALAQDTKIIIMDEPTAHLDFKNELFFLETIERLVTSLNVTVLMATHAPNQAFHLANAGVPTSIALMHAGRITMVGSPKHVLTEQTLHDVFGIEAFLLEREADEASNGRLVRQIVAQRTVQSNEVSKEAL